MPKRELVKQAMIRHHATFPSWQNRPGDEDERIRVATNRLNALAANFGLTAAEINSVRADQTVAAILTRRPDAPAN